MSTESGSSPAALKIGSAIRRIVSSISASRMTVAARAGQATASSGHQPQCQRQPSHSPVSPAHPHHPCVDPLDAPARQTRPGGTGTDG